MRSFCIRLTLLKESEVCSYLGPTEVGALALEISSTCRMPLFHTQTQRRPTPLAPLRPFLTIASHSAPNGVTGKVANRRKEPESRKKLGSKSLLRQGVYLRNLGLVLVSGVVVVEEVEEGEEEEAAAAS